MKRDLYILINSIAAQSQFTLCSMRHPKWNQLYHYILTISPKSLERKHAGLQCLMQHFTK